MLLRIAIIAGLACALASAAEHRGIVKSNGLPIPGATVTAALGDQRIATSTDETGSYDFPNLWPGVWEIRVEMMGFAPAVRELKVAETSPALDFDLKLQAAQPAPAAAAAKPVAHSAAANAPAAPAAETAKPQGGPQTARNGVRGPAGANGNGGFQRLQIAQAAQNEVQAALNGPAPEMPTQETAQDANESFLVTGSVSRGLQSPDMMDQAFGFGPRMGMMMGGGSDGQGGPGAMGGSGAPGMQGGPGGPGGGGPGMMRGGPGGFGGGGFGGRGGPGGFGGRGAQGGRDGRGPMNARARGNFNFGNRSGRGREGFHGGASFSLRNSAMDAKPYSLTGQDIGKPSYAQSRFSLVGGGVLHIPKIVTDDKTFVFFSYFGTRSRNPFNAVSTVPSVLERGGDFSQSVANGPVKIYDPLTSQPFPNNQIPASRVDPAAQKMLSFFPLPNQPGLVQNYQFITSYPQNTDNFGTRASRSVTRKDRLAGSFNLQQRNSSSVQLFGFRDTGTGRGFNANVTWTHTFAPGVISNMRFYMNRNSSDQLPYFAYGVDWASALGILGTSSDPRNYGPPNLSFTNFGALSDGSPSVQHNQTGGVSEGLIRVVGKQTVTVGADYHRMQLNSITDSNGRGTYTFSGLATSGFGPGGSPLAGTGFDLADYLLGRPQSSSIRYGSSDMYFRNSSYSAYIQDDWRLRSNLTINAGLRYEYLTPLHEKYGRMANLDIAPYFTGVAVVTPSQAGPYTGNFPDGLVNPDNNNLAPRLGMAWRPFPNKQIQLRAGYGWYYNGSVYNTAASRMAQQPPFANSLSVNTSLENPLSIATGFTAVELQQISNTFAVNRYYRVGYAQTWNFAYQMDLPHSFVMEVGYLGTKGTRLDIQRMPNRAAPGSPLTSEDRRQIANATGFTFDSSEGSSIYHAGQVRLMRRFRSGIALNAMYTYSKSIDNSSIGGTLVAQNDQDLAAERAVSTFNRPHNLTVNWMFSTSGSPATAGQRSVWMRDWQLTGGITVRSGAPYTAMVLGNRSDAGGTGAVGSGRADATGLPITFDGYFFNPLAFALPPAGQFGNAGRNTITGPTMFAVNASFGRTIRFGETRKNLDLRIEANNLLNTVTITGIGSTVNASNYGLALNAASMRSMSLNLRFRF